MTNSLGGWRATIESQARTGKDKRYQMAIQHERAGHRLRNSNPEAALEAFEKGRELAEALNEPCWILHFGNLIARLCNYQLEDLDRAMAIVVRDTILAGKPAYEKCPFKSDVQHNLLETYFYFDPVGYEAEIRSALDYMQNSTEHRTTWTATRLQDIRAQLALKLDQYDEALYLALKATEKGGFASTDAYLTLVRVHWERGEYDQALDAALVRKNNLNRIFSSDLLADARAWTAALLQRLGRDEERAMKDYQFAISVITKSNTVPNSTVFDALADYHEVAGDMENTLNIRDRQLAEQRPNVGPDELTAVRLRRARLLGRMGKSEALQAQLTEARELAQRLHKPQPYLDKLQRIEDGNYQEVLYSPDHP